MSSLCGTKARGFLEQRAENMKHGGESIMLCGCVAASWLRTFPPFSSTLANTISAWIFSLNTCLQGRAAGADGVWPVTTSWCHCSPTAQSLYPGVAHLQHVCDFRLQVVNDDRDTVLTEMLSRPTSWSLFVCPLVNWALSNRVEMELHFRNSWVHCYPETSSW